MSKARRPALATVRGFEVHALKAPGPSRIGVLVGGRLVALDIGSIDCVEASGNHA